MRIIGTLHKTSSLPADVEPPLTQEEHHIFAYINSVCEAIPVLSNGEYGTVTARLAGGWVRDKLMPLVRNDVPVKPPKDLDFAVDIMDGATFGEYMSAYDRVSGIKAYTPGASRDPTAQKVGVSHGKIYGYEVEFTQLRKEGYGIEGDRKSVQVEAGSIEEDTYRRDLTINAMYYNLRTGLVEDVTGQGYDDLATLTLRTPTRPGQDPADEVDRIFTEDPVRVLRVVRFFSRWPNAKIDPVILEKMSEPKIHDLISRKLRDRNLNKHDPGVSAEGLADELRKVMKGEQPAEALEVLYKTGLMTEIMNLPDPFHDLNMDQRNRHHQLTVIEHSIEVLRNMNKLSKEFGFDDSMRMMMNFSAWFHDIGKLDPRSHKNKDDGSRGYSGDPENPDSMTHQQSSAEQWKRFANILKMSDEEKKMVYDLVADHMNPHAHIEGMEGSASDKQLRKYIRKNPTWVYQYVHAMADAMSKSRIPNPEATEPYRANLERLRSLAPSADSFGNMAPANDLLNGGEIIQLVGLPPNPPTGMTGYIEIVKERIRDAQDSNPDLTKDQAIQIVQGMLSSGELDAYRV